MVCMGRKRYDAHRAVGETLKFITSSKVRTRIMLGLQEEPKTSSVLRDEVSASASSIIHAARDLEKEDLLVEKEDGYHLTSLGSIVASQLDELVETMYVLDSNRQFWLTHDADAIPQEFLERLHELQGVEVVKSAPTDLVKALSTYLKLIRAAERLTGVSPILHPEFPGVIEKLVRKGVDVELILTEEVFERGKANYPHLFQELIAENNFQVWVSDIPVGVAFTVTDTFMSLGLFDLNGNFDSDTDLVSKDKGAINWGRELFEYYRKRAHRIREGA